MTYGKLIAMTTKQVRIRDVAQLAGVSTATVSRALSNPDMVSPATRAVVQAAITQTGYRPNEAARNLRQSRTGGIVALVPDLGNPFFAKILSGIASVLGPAGYNLLIADTHSGNPAGLAHHVDPSRVDGVINLDGTLPLALLRGSVPVVDACEWVPDLQVPRVRIDNHAAAAMAVNHLADLGHRRIGHVTGPAGNVLSLARLEGFQAAMAARGLEAGPIYQGDFSLQSGGDSAMAWLAEPPDLRPSAMFIAADAMACGFIAQLSRHRLSVPDAVSVVGFDDIELTSLIAPPLTTIHQPRAKLGEMAARRLLAEIDGSGGAPDCLIGVDLLIRGSTAPPRD